VTLLPVRIEPGACYLAAAAPDRGRVTAARLTAEVGSRSVRDQSTKAPHGVAVSFCAGRAQQAQLQLDVRAGFTWWTLLLWRVAGGQG
jgi:hypothetical protein